MAVFSVVRVLLLLLTAFAVEAFVATVRTPRFSSSTPSLVRQRPTSAQRAATPPYLPSTLRMASSYDDGSGAAAGGEVTGSTEMELQELVVDFTDDGRILLEVKGVKVGPEGNVPQPLGAMIFFESLNVMIACAMRSTRCSSKDAA